MKVSIILPVYNGGAYLAAAIRSALDQSFKDFELIILEDCSTDSSKEIIKGFADPRIRLVEHAENQGLINTLNEGLRLARGAYIARIDADDAWTAIDKLAKQIDFLDTHPDHNLVGTQALMVDENGKELFSSRRPLTDSDIRNRILTENCFIHPSMLFRKEAALAAGGFVEGEKYIEDYSLWLRMGKKASFANLPETLMLYRIHTKGETQKNNLAQIRNSISLIRKYRKDYPRYPFAWAKWTAKLILINVFKPSLFLKVKSFVYR